MQRFMIALLVVAMAVAVPAMASTTVIGLSGTGPTGGVWTNTPISGAFTINYQPLGTGSYIDNSFGDYPLYKFSMNPGGGLTDYHSNGIGWYLNRIASYRVVAQR